MPKTIEHHEVDLLASAIGIPIIVTLSGGSGPMEISRWRNGDIVPSAEQAEKLSCALAVLTKIRYVKGLRRACAWFISLSVGEDKDQPAIAILDGRFAEVHAAANEMLGSRFP